VLAQLQADRRSMFRRIFGTYPLHLLPPEQRVLNLRQTYRRWLEGGRVLFLPLQLTRQALRLAGGGLRLVRSAIDQVRNPVLESIEESARSDFATALRKIQRMRGPSVLASTRERAQIDVEYLGVALPGLNAADDECTTLERDLDFMVVPFDFREELARERDRAKGDVRRLEALLANGLVEQLRERIGSSFEWTHEHLRALTCAYRADRDGLRSLLSAGDLLEEALQHAREDMLVRPHKFLPRAGAWLAFRRFCRSRGCDERDVRRRAWRALLHDRHGTRGALKVWSTLGEERAFEQGLSVLAEILRHPGRVTEQLVTMRAIHTLALIDIRNYRGHVWNMGGYASEEPDLAEQLWIDPDFAEAPPQPVHETALS